MIGYFKNHAQSTLVMDICAGLMEWPVILVTAILHFITDTFGKQK